MQQSLFSSPSSASTVAMPLEVPLSDDELASQAIHDFAAWETLYDRYFLFVYRYIALNVSYSPDIEDLTADTFEAALHALGKRRNKSEFSTWLLGIAKNKIRNFYRKNDKTFPDPLVGQPPSVEEDVSRAIALECLNQAIRRLKPNSQQIIILRFLGGLQLKQIGQQIGISHSNARKRLQRALGKLSKDKDLRRCIFERWSRK